MNMLEALTTVRALALDSGRSGERRSQKALAVVDRKIQGLQRKKAWRDCSAGEMPAHMTDPLHPLNAGRKWEAPPKAAPEPGDLIPMWTARGSGGPS